MGKRSSAVHVARVVRKYKDREYVSFLLRRSYREAGKVRHETLANLSALPAQAIADCAPASPAAGWSTPTRHSRSPARCHTGMSPRSGR
jgi:hypothetical protein